MNWSELAWEITLTDEIALKSVGADGAWRIESEGLLSSSSAKAAK